MAPDQLIEVIYEAAEDRLGLQRVAAELSGALEATTGHIFLLGGDGSVLETSFHGADLAAIAEYHAHYQFCDPRFEIAVATPDRVYSDVEVLDSATFERSEIYNDHLRPNNARYTMFVNLAVADGLFAPQAFLRPPDAPAFGPKDIAQLERLLPHVRRAIHLRRLLMASQVHARDLGHALDLIPAPVLVLTGTGEIVCANAAAEQMLRAVPGLTVHHRRLTARHPAVENALSAALRQSLALADATNDGKPPPAVVEIEREGARPLGLVYFPLRPRHSLRLEGERSARVLVVLHDPEAILRIDPEVLARLHRLTPTEALLAVALAEGKSVAQFALARGSSEHTARVHLKRLLDKTGCQRQADLVRLLLSSHAAHVAGRI